jgi:hypothetical protein
MRRVLPMGFLALCLTAPAAAQPSPEPPTAEMRALIEATREGAKAARENADHARVVPDILTQILHKLDKLEDKLDKVEEAIKREAPRRNAR